MNERSPERSDDEWKAVMEKESSRKATVMAIANALQGQKASQSSTYRAEYNKMGLIWLR